MLRGCKDGASVLEVMDKLKDTRGMGERHPIDGRHLAYPGPEGGGGDAGLEHRSYWE